MAAELNETLAREITILEKGGGVVGGGSTYWTSALGRFTEAHFLHLAKVRQACRARATAICGDQQRKRKRGFGGKLLGTTTFPSAHGKPTDGGACEVEICQGSSACNAREETLVVSVNWTQVPTDELETGLSSILTCSGNMESRSAIEENIERGVRRAEEAAAEFKELLADQDGIFGLQEMSSRERAAMSMFDGGSVFEALLDRSSSSRGGGSDVG